MRPDLMMLDLTASLVKVEAMRGCNENRFAMQVQPKFSTEEFEGCLAHVVELEKQLAAMIQKAEQKDVKK